MGFGGVIACNQVGIPIVAMLTGVSILGLAVGFAAQETLANFIAGIVIFWDKPFKVGDWLTVDGSFGQVQRITFRSCRLLAPGGEVDIYPNTLVLARRVANHSAHPTSRISVSVPLGDRPLHAARARMLATTHGDRRVVADPPPEVVVSECTKESTTLALRFWVADPAVEQAGRLRVPRAGQAGRRRGRPARRRRRWRSRRDRADSIRATVKRGQPLVIGAAEQPHHL